MRRKQNLSLNNDSSPFRNNELSYNTINYSIEQDEVNKNNHNCIQCTVVSTKENKTKTKLVKLPISTIVRKLSPNYKYTQHPNKSVDINESNKKCGTTGKQPMIEKIYTNQHLKPSRILVAHSPKSKNKKYSQQIQTKGGYLKGGIVKLGVDYYNIYIIEIIRIQRWWKRIIKKITSKTIAIHNNNNSNQFLQDDYTQTDSNYYHKINIPQTITIDLKHVPKEEINNNLNEVISISEIHDNRNKIYKHKLNFNLSPLKIDCSFRQSIIYKNKVFARELIQPVKQLEQTINPTKITHKLKQKNILSYHKENDLNLKGTKVNNNTVISLRNECEMLIKEIKSFSTNDLKLNNREQINFNPIINDIYYTSKVKQIWNKNKNISINSFSLINKPHILKSRAKPKTQNTEIISSNEFSFSFHTSSDYYKNKLRPIWNIENQERSLMDVTMLPKSSRKKYKHLKCINCFTFSIFNTQSSKWNNKCQVVNLFNKNIFISNIKKCFKQQNLSICKQNKYFVLQKSFKKKKTLQISRNELCYVIKFNNKPLQLKVFKNEKVSYIHKSNKLYYQMKIKKYWNKDNSLAIKNNNLYIRAGGPKTFTTPIQISKCLKPINICNNKKKRNTFDENKFQKVKSINICLQKIINKQYYKNKLYYIWNKEYKINKNVDYKIIPTLQDKESLLCYYKRYIISDWIQENVISNKINEFILSEPKIIHAYSNIIIINEYSFSYETEHTILKTTAKPKLRNDQNEIDSQFINLNSKINYDYYKRKIKPIWDIENQEHSLIDCTVLPSNRQKRFRNLFTSNNINGSIFSLSQYNNKWITKIHPQTQFNQKLSYHNTSAPDCRKHNKIFVILSFQFNHIPNVNYIYYKNKIITYWLHILKKEVNHFQICNPIKLSWNELNKSDKNIRKEILSQTKPNWNNIIKINNNQNIINIERNKIIPSIISNLNPIELTGKNHKTKWNEKLFCISQIHFDTIQRIKKPSAFDIILLKWKINSSLSTQSFNYLSIIKAIVPLSQSKSDFSILSNIEKCTIDNCNCLCHPKPKEVQPQKSKAGNPKRKEKDEDYSRDLLVTVRKLDDNINEINENNEELDVLSNVSKSRNNKKYDVIFDSIRKSNISYKSCNYQPESKSKPNINIPGNRGQNEETIKMRNLLKGNKKDDWLYVRDFESSGNK